MKKVIVFIFFIKVVCLSFCLGLFFFISHHHTIDFSSLERYDHGVPTRLFDDEGVEWARFQRDIRSPVPYTQLPKYLIHAFVAAEDHAFFRHSGISLKGIIRSLGVNIYYGSKRQGASTITQQLVKLLFVGSEKTFIRKIKEQIGALLIERRYTKEQILETYLNHIYFGCGIYGVEAACQRFWHKSVHDVSLAEAATLAGIVRSPGNYCPLLYPLSAKKRRDVILASMYTRMAFISEEEYAIACHQDVSVQEDNNTQLAPHVKEKIRIFIEKLIGVDQLYRGGFIVQTTLNSALQTQAEKLFTSQVRYLRKEVAPSIDGGLITLAVGTGEIKSLIGGFDFRVSKFNRALQARRQLGSLFKTVIYAAAIEEGKRFSDTIIDEPIALSSGSGVWRPKNNMGQFEGVITRAFALAHSNNIVTIKTLLEIGCDKAVEMARRFHIADSLEPYPSLALGCIDCSLEKVIGMFHVFANHGEYIEPHMLKWIKDMQGKKIWINTPKKESLIAPRVAGQVAKVLSIGLERARKRSKSWITSESIGKSGTTNDSRSTWFVGATPDFVTGIYLGNDDNTSLGKNIYGSGTAFPLWLEIHKNLPVTKKDFSFDSRLQEIIIHERTGEQLFSKDDPAAIAILI